MGMYDTLNGEQVKCFPWFSFYVSAMDTKGVVTEGQSWMLPDLSVPRKTTNGPI